MEMNLIVPLISEKDILNKYRNENSRFFKFKNNSYEPYQIKLVYKPYYFHLYSYTAKTFNKSITEEVRVLTDGLSNISAIIDGDIKINKENNISDKEIVNLRVSQKESEESSLGIVEKNMYMKYKHYYKCELLERKIIYRGFYILNMKDKKKSVILHGDSYEIK